MQHALVVQDRSLVYLVAAGFLVSLVGVGLVFRRFSRDSRDYFCANGQAKWWLVGGSLFMQSFSAWTFTGAAGAAYRAGWSVMVMYGAGVVANLFVARFAGPWFRQLRVTTQADAVRLRFGVGMEQFYSYLQLAAGFMFSGAQLFALAIFTSTILGFEVWAVIVVLGVVVLFYTAMSGAWAVLAADFVQALVLVPVTLMLAFICLARLGGLDGMFEAIEAAGLRGDFAPFKSTETVASLPGVSAGYFTLGFFVAWYLNTTIQNSSLLACGKYLAVKDGREARRAALLASGLALLGMMVFFLPPMAARLLVPEAIESLPLNNPAEGAYAGIALHLLPPGLVGLVLVAMCAATMSSLDGGITGLAAIITQNAYPALCRRFGRTPIEGRARLAMGRVVNLVCAVSVIALALVLAKMGAGGVFALVLDIIAVLLAPVALPLMLGVFVRRVQRYVAPVAIVCGLCTGAGAAFLPSWTGGEPWLYHERIFAVVVAGTCAFFAARRFGPRLDHETAAIEVEFFSRRDRPVDFAVEVGAGNDSRQMRVIGCFALALCGGFLLLALAESSRDHLGKFMVPAVFAGGVAAALFSRARIARPR
jgi:SSS family transporter